jgi:hypothetical protein
LTCISGPPRGIRRRFTEPSSTPLIFWARRCRAASGPRRRSVLYGDDRQVKFLYADLDQAWARDDTDGTSAGSIFIVAQRASDVIAGLCMAGRLHQERWNDEDEESPFWAPRIPEDPEPGWLLDPGSARSPIERYLADSFRFHHVMDAQEAILAQTDGRLLRALSSYLDDLDRGNVPARLAVILEESRAASRSLLLSDALTMPLPGLPRATGESADFVRRIRASLKEFRSRWPMLRSLLVPVTLTFLVIPPVQGKNLDNIALTVLPIAHEVLRPHISPHLLSPADGGDPDPRLDQALARLKSVNARSVCAYQVIELPRTLQDPPEGTLRLALGLHTHWSWWHRTGTYVSSAIDRAEQHGTLDDLFWRSVFTGW